MRVIIAEDDPISRKILEVQLRKWGYELEVANDGAEAWAGVAWAGVRSRSACLYLERKLSFRTLRLCDEDPVDRPRYNEPLRAAREPRLRIIRWRSVIAQYASNSCILAVFARMLREDLNRMSCLPLLSGSSSRKPR